MESLCHALQYTKEMRTRLSLTGLTLRNNTVDALYLIPALKKAELKFDETEVKKKIYGCVVGVAVHVADVKAAELARLTERKRTYDKWRSETLTATGPAEPAKKKRKK